MLCLRTAEVVVDLDDLGSWPAEVRSELDEKLDGLIAEYDAQTQFDLSGDHWFKPPPPKPLTRRAQLVITEQMKAMKLRVFHATRLLDFNEVVRDGIRPLVLDERVARLRELAAQRRLADFEDEIGEIIGRVDLTDNCFTIREARVWATPLRRYLHDGGCDVFFDHWGGEAVQRLAHMASPALEAAIQGIGNPAVVVAKIPALGFCKRSNWRLAPTMLELALEASGRVEVSVGAWDVCAELPIPPEWIEGVVPPDDATVSDPRRT